VNAWLLAFGRVAMPVIAVAGCSTVSELQSVLDAKQPCCKSYAEMSFQPMQTDESVDFRLNESSPVYVFDTGKSYFKAFQLPTDSTGKTLRIISSATGSVGLETRKWAQVYCPRTIFLDSGMSAIAVHEQLPIFQRGSMFARIDHGFISDALIPQSAQFAVLHANAAKFGTIVRSMTTGGGAYMVGKAAVYEPGGESIPFPCAPIADARVRIR
jgi:hypothetical protein